MPRRISSGWTFFDKFIFPAVWISAFGLGVISLVRDPPDGIGWLIFPIIWILGGAWQYWSFGRLKRVVIDAESLVVSNYFRERRIPSHGLAQGLEQALLMLEKNYLQPDHVFWSLERSVTQMLPEIRHRLAGHQQLTDTILLDLAIRNGGRLVMLDRRVTHLLARDSPHLAAIAVIPTE